MRDLLPSVAEAWLRAEAIALDELRSRGYSYLVTPLLESLETVSTGLTTQQQRQLFK
ncbi:MAG: ATP phosphoribosyltransferase regulatory subunit, partial [Candidatus Dormibacteraceae bacterium]